MENSDDKGIISVRIKKKPEPKIEPQPLLTQNDVRRFVTEFVSSWIRGDIIIRFPTAAELARKTPLSIAFPTDPSVNAELKIKEHYINQLSIIAGIVPASAEEQEKAIGEVFKMLLMFRSANRIEGKIISNDLEKRIEELEKTVKNQGKLVDQITGFLFKPKTPAKKPKAK
ncbi:MAG TPA: hypothetical protein VK536_07745 [Candidatus Limnocylindrales bacterium]|nr:hypothetical protein [Candidatus Limnocylindrales bacterium]